MIRRLVVPIVAFLLVMLCGTVGPVHAQELYSLPVGARYTDGGLDSETILLSIVLNGEGNQGQSIEVTPSHTVTGTVRFQIWSGGGPGILKQAFFIASWSPSWPPVSSHYFPVYNGQPGYSPGVVQTTNLWFTAPAAEGIYYLWFCSGAQYSMTDAVNKFTSYPGLPAHARIKVTHTPVPELPGGVVPLALFAALAASVWLLRRKETTSPLALMKLLT